MAEFIESIRQICTSPAQFDLHDWEFYWDAGYRESAEAYADAMGCE